MATPRFEAQVANPFGIANGQLPGLRRYSFAPVFADIDGDGDLDLFAGYDINSVASTVQFSLNTGTPTVPVFAAPVTNPFNLVDIPFVDGSSGTWTAPAFADIDGDGDLDLFVGDKYAGATYFQNTGTRTAPNFAAPVTNPFGVSDVGFHHKPTFVDIDGDGDLDAFAGEEYGSTFFFRNTGTRTAPAFAAPVKDAFGLRDIDPAAFTSDFASPSFADADGDGDFDAFIGNDSGNIFFFENTGTRTAPSFAAPITNPFGLADAGFWASPTFADINGDGDLDLFAGETFNVVKFFENSANDPSLSVAAGANAAEPGTAGNFTLTLSRGAPAGGLTVFYAVSGTATNGADYATLAGSVTFAAGATTATVTVTPSADGLGEGDETVILTLLDRSGYVLGANAAATITLSDAVNDPPVANDEPVATNEDTAVTIDVLSNDTDPNDDPLSLVSFTDGANGTVTCDDNGTAADLTDDRLVYTPAPDFNGRDSFTYTISDGQGGTATATVSVGVNSANDPASITGTAIGAVTEDAATPNLTVAGALTVSDPDSGEAAFDTA